MLCTLSSSSSHSAIAFGVLHFAAVQIESRAADTHLPKPSLMADDHAPGTDFLGTGQGTAFDHVVDLDGLIVHRSDDHAADFAQATVFFGPEEVGGGGEIVGLEELLCLHRVQAAADEADVPHVLHDRPLKEVVAADIGVAVGHRVLQLLERDAVTLQAVRVGMDLIAFDRAAKAGDVGDPRHAAELAFQGPVL